MWNVEEEEVSTALAVLQEAERLQTVVLARAAVHGDDVTIKAPRITSEWLKRKFEERYDKWEDSHAGAACQQFLRVNICCHGPYVTWLVANRVKVEKNVQSDCTKRCRCFDYRSGVESVAARNRMTCCAYCHGCDRQPRLCQPSMWRSNICSHPYGAVYNGITNYRSHL